MPRPAAAITTVAAIACAALYAGMLTGCSSRPPEASSSSPHGSGKAVHPTPSLPARLVAERDAMAAYRGMWRAFVHASQTSNAKDPLLARYATGTALATITTALTRSHNKGEISKGNVVLHPSVTSATPADAPSEVDLKDCADDSSWLKYHSNGTLINDVPGGKHLVMAVVSRSTTAWKVSDFAAHGVGTCT